MKLRIIAESDDFFSYGTMHKNFWNELLYNAQKDQKIDFNLENNDSIDRKKIKISNSDSGNYDSRNSEFKCELWAAGGDWECSTNYFRIQWVSGPSISTEEELVWIPSIKEGNPGLIKCKSGYCPHDANDDDATDSDDVLCWKSLKEYLKSSLEEFNSE